MGHAAEPQVLQALMTVGDQIDLHTVAHFADACLEFVRDGGEQMALVMQILSAIRHRKKKDVKKLVLNHSSCTCELVQFNAPGFC